MNCSNYLSHFYIPVSVPYVPTFKKRSHRQFKLALYSIGNLRSISNYWSLSYVPHSIGILTANSTTKPCAYHNALNTTKTLSHWIIIYPQHKCHDHQCNYCWYSRGISQCRLPLSIGQRLLLVPKQQPTN